MWDCIEDVVKVAGGMVALEVAGQNAEISLEMVVAGGALAAQLGQAVERHGPERGGAIRRARKKVRSTIDEWQDHDPKELKIWDKALASMLPDCMLNRSALAESALQEGGFPEAATNLILDELSGASVPPGLIDRLTGYAAYEPGNEGKLFAAGPARKFAHDVIHSAIVTTYHDREYFARIAPYLTFKIAETVGDIARGQQQVLANQEGNDAMLWAMAEELGLAENLKKRGFTDKGARAAVARAGQTSAKPEIQLMEVEQSSGMLDTSAQRQDHVTDKAMQLARDGGFEEASELLKRELERSAERRREADELHQHLTRTAEAVQRLRNDPRETARMVVSELERKHVDHGELDRAVASEIQRRRYAALPFDRLVSAEMAEIMLGTARISDFPHAKGWWARSAADSHAAWAELQIGWEPFDVAVERANLSIQALEQAAAWLDLVYAVSSLVKIRGMQINRSGPQDLLDGTVAVIDTWLSHPEIAGKDREEMVLLSAMARCLCIVSRRSGNTEHFNEAVKKMRVAIAKADALEMYHDRLQMRHDLGNWLGQNPTLNIAQHNMGVAYFNDAEELIRESGYTAPTGFRSDHLEAKARLASATRNYAALPDLISGFHSIAEEMWAEESWHNWWTTIQRHHYYLARYAFLARDKAAFVRATRELADTIEKGKAMALPLAYTASYCRSFLEIADLRVWPIEQPVIRELAGQEG